VLHQELVIELLHGDITSVLAAQAGEDISLSRAWDAAEALVAAPGLPVLQGSSDVDACTAGAALQPLQGSGMLSSTVQSKFTGSGINSTTQQQHLQGQQIADEALDPAAACHMDTSGSAAAAVGSSSGSSELVAHSYTAELLRTATPSDLHSVANMTPQGWHQTLYELFLQLVVLLEFVNRSSAGAAHNAGNAAVGSSSQLPPLAEASWTAAAAEAAAPETAAASAAGLSAAEPAARAAARPEFIQHAVCGGPQGTLEQLQCTVDVVMRRVVLAYMFNHVPLLEACSVEYASNLPASPPAVHWQVRSAEIQISNFGQTSDLT
jgi:hypothetical protein